MIYLQAARITIFLRSAISIVVKNATLEVTIVLNSKLILFDNLTHQKVCASIN